MSAENGRVPSTFVLTTDAPVDAGRLFDLSLDIEEHTTSMAQSRERAIAGTTSGRIALGETVTWRARHFGFWFEMTSKITAFDAPHAFVDEQVAGPFRAFVHEHRFEPTADGCRMTDTVTLASPVFGRVAERLVLVPYLRRLIAERNRHLLTALV